MRITNFTYKHVNEAQAIVMKNYEEEKQLVPFLPEITTLPDLDHFAENGLGMVAIRNDEVIGFLCCYEPWSNAFGTEARGTFSPLHAHGSIIKDRESIYRNLYQAAANHWVNQGITYHSISLFAHDEQAKQALFTNGFGLRCIDSIKLMDPIPLKKNSNIQIRRLDHDDVICIRSLREQLSNHLSKSPCFMYTSKDDYKSWISRAEQRDSIVYAAFDKEKAVAFVEVKIGGENFITDRKDMMNICGAFCLEEYTGEDIVQNILNRMISDLRNDGYQLLGVDYESINPTAYKFWNKYFIPYTNSVTRRIDEGILKGDRGIAYEL